MLNGRTSTGFEFLISDSVLSDWRLVRNLAKLETLEENPEAIEIDFINVMAEIESIMFKDKGKALEKHIQSQNEGAVPTDVLLKELIEIIRSNNQTKN